MPTRKKVSKVSTLRPGQTPPRNKSGLVKTSWGTSSPDGTEWPVRRYWPMGLHETSWTKDLRRSLARTRVVDEASLSGEPSSPSLSRSSKG